VTTPRLTVQPGDSLWLIAAHRLAAGASPGEISAEWHRWYAANLALIGDDPDLIRPGTTLTAPTAGEQR
jgi:nucleoid-associated protein YgaU